jgi:FHS family L-fucose permease-like MFS transporter
MIGRFLGASCYGGSRPDISLPFCDLCSFPGRRFHVSERARGDVNILAVGFFSSIMFPTIFSRRGGDRSSTGNGSGILNMAIVGGAVLPVLGALSLTVLAFTTHSLFRHLLLYIVFYGLSGSSRANGIRCKGILDNMLLAGNIGGTKTDLAMF